MKHISVADLTIGNDCPLTLIAGPCQLESADHAQMVAGKLKEACDKAGAQFVFKGSFDKANRTSLNAKPALGLDEGLKVLDSVKKQIGVPVITDIHEKEQCEPVAAVVDIMQIPAFLCRQTALLLAAGKTGAAINVKKGQFLAPWDMPNVVTKIESTGNDRILLTERGVSFGYNRLVVDMQSLPEMARTGYPCCRATRRPGRSVRWTERICPGSCKGGCRHRHRGCFHRNPRRPRQCALRRAKHDLSRPDAKADRDADAL